MGGRDVDAWEGGWEGRVGVGGVGGEGGEVEKEEEEAVFAAVVGEGERWVAGGRGRVSYGGLMGGGRKEACGGTWGTHGYWSRAS